jgi:thiamine-phosphate pyrophosphorylase
MTHNDRMRRFLEAGVYLVTSEALSHGRSTLAIVRAALAGGVRLVQLREKSLPVRDLLRLAADVRRLTEDAGALLVINDRLDVALAVRADGVHLGQEDLPVGDARRIAPDLIVGASSHSVREARDAQAAGASYVNIGPIFPTRTKPWRGGFLGLDGMRAIAPSLAVPFTAMGGIKREHIPQLARAGARTVAVVTAITAAADPERAARELLDAMTEHGGRRGAALPGAPRMAAADEPAAGGAGVVT